MSPGSNTESYPAFAHIELRKNPGKNLNQSLMLAGSEFQSLGRAIVKEDEYEEVRWDAREGPRPTSRLLASRPHAEAEVDDHPTSMETVLKLRCALREKRPGKIILQHDNDWSHTDRVTVEKIRTFGWETLPQSPYSPDLAPSDYHLFSSVKEQLRGQRYETLEDIQKAVRQCLFGKMKRTSKAREFSNLHNSGKNVCKEMETMLKSDRKACRFR
ncbi:hypothetical protein ANN_07608 [Periplaneta americana]|uniref:Mariner Mos1 transposase n=1 Tax=Periplaneta americana TaxID=6978 RepID=A0ABQ8SZ75_PERAM|nr:hypothetical protein ANN_07608 [Periplaneta americana]